MTPTSQMQCAMPRLAVSLFLLLALSPALSFAQTSDDEAARQAALLAKRPAKLRRPPPSVGSPAAAPVKQAAFESEVLEPQAPGAILSGEIVGPGVGYPSSGQYGFLGGRYGASGP